MADAVRTGAISELPIDADGLADSIRRDSDGAVVEFRGIVRDHDRGRSVALLEYEAHPSAADRLRDAVDAVVARHPEVAVAVVHRVGSLAVGELALLCAVSAAHRGDAFAACAELVDEVKATVPIWKRQVFDDGTAEWVGIGDAP